MSGAVTVTAISINGGTAVLVIASCSVPTLDTWPQLKTKGQWPSTFTLTWRWSNGSETTYTYGVGTEITRLPSPNTSVATCTLSTSTGTSNQITGYVEAKGECTATAGFEINVKALAA